MILRDQSRKYETLGLDFYGTLDPNAAAAQETLWINSYLKLKLGTTRQRCPLALNDTFIEFPRWDKHPTASVNLPSNAAKENQEHDEFDVWEVY